MEQHIHNLERLWPYIVVIGGAIAALFRWIAVRVDRGIQRKEEQEERRTQAVEQIPKAITDLKELVDASLKAEGEATRRLLVEMEERIVSKMDNSRLDRMESMVERFVNASEVTEPEEPPAPEVASPPAGRRRQVTLPPGSVRGGSEATPRAAGSGREHRSSVP